MACMQHNSAGFGQGTKAAGIIDVYSYRYSSAIDILLMYQYSLVLIAFAIVAIACMIISLLSCSGYNN